MQTHFARLAFITSCSLLACRRDATTDAPDAPLAATANADAQPEPSAAPTTEPEPAATPAAAPTIDAPPAEPAAAEPTPAEAPPAEAPPAEPASLVAVEGANATVGDTEADALHLTELACAVDRPLLGSLAVIAALSKQGAALDRCAPKGDAAVVHFAFADGRPRDITVRGASSKKVEACIVAALKKVRSPMDARCGAVLHVGDEAGAREAHARLAPAG